MRAVHHFLHGRAPCEDAEAAGAVEQLSGEDAEKETALPAWGYAACSAGSAAVAAVCTQPLDVVKTRLQVCISQACGLRSSFCTCDFCISASRGQVAVAHHFRRI